jgi:hypothetical protein
LNMAPAHAPRIGARKRSHLSDAVLIERAQRQTFHYFWEGAHPLSGLARDRCGVEHDPQGDLVATGGSGFGMMAIIVATERGWVKREAAVARFSLMLDVLERAPCYHGVFPHFMNGATGATVPFSRKDDGGDLVETAFLCQGLLCARQYFDRDGVEERRLRARLTALWREVEWSWHMREGARVLTWHWSPNNGFSLGHAIRGWNECLLAYVLAAGAPRFPIDTLAYREGWAQSRSFLNGRCYYDIELPLGPPFGGPLFFAHYSFCGLDPRGLSDSFADYWRQNVAHVEIHLDHCRRNPNGHAGFGDACWGLTSCDGPSGYSEHSPCEDDGVIAPTAALSSFPYAPKAALAALRYFYENLGDRLWGRFGFADAFQESSGWVSNAYIAIDQGPIVAMIENYRSGLLWRLFMKDPDVATGLRRLGFSSPHLT